ncbi:MAG: hypothetical protein QMC26_05520 [Pseudomonadales bacterium]
MSKLYKKQIRILWAEILSRNLTFEPMGESERSYSHVVMALPQCR